MGALLKSGITPMPPQKLPEINVVSNAFTTECLGNSSALIIIYA